MSAGISPFGDRALRFPLEPSIDRRALLFTLRVLDGVVDVVLAEDTGAVVLATPAHRPAVTTALASALASASASALPSASASASASALAPAPAHHTIRVVYDGEDLPHVSSATGLSIEAVIALHAGGDYEVAMLGFLPGFAYLRGLDTRLGLPRRSTPRTRVPAGSLAMAAEYTGIYPFASPGGWNLLGRVVGYRAFGERGATLALGDHVRFVADPGSTSTSPVAFTVRFTRACRTVARWCPSSSPARTRPLATAPVPRRSSSTECSRWWREAEVSRSATTPAAGACWPRAKRSSSRRRDARACAIWRCAAESMLRWSWTDAGRC